jgi:hypothetical protein
VANPQRRWRPDPGQTRNHRRASADRSRFSAALNLRVADIRSTWQQLQSAGAEFLTGPIDRGPAIRCYLHDPDGHLIEILPVGSGYTTLEIKFNLVCAITAETGQVICSGQVVHRGARVCTAEARLTAAGDEKLLAHGTSTCLVISHAGAGR